MSLREDMEKAMKKVVEAGHVEDAEAVAFVKKQFRKTLEHCEETKTSVKAASIEMLEGLKDGLEAGGHESKELLNKAASAMLDVARESGEKTISGARRAADSSKAALDAELGKVHGSIDQVKQKTKDDMKMAYAKLREKTEVEKERLRQMNGAFDTFKENAKEKSHVTLNNAAEESKGALLKFEQSAREYGEKLLHHSKDKTANWLKKMADKIESK